MQVSELTIRLSGHLSTGGLADLGGVPYEGPDSSGSKFMLSSWDALRGEHHQSGLGSEMFALQMAGRRANGLWAKMGANPIF